MPDRELKIIAHQCEIEDSLDDTLSWQNMHYPVCAICLVCTGLLDQCWSNKLLQYRQVQMNTVDPLPLLN